MRVGVPCIKRSMTQAVHFPIARTSRTATLYGSVEQREGVVSSLENAAADFPLELNYIGCVMIVRP